jgi:predicted transcriptional regulator
VKNAVSRDEHVRTEVETLLANRHERIRALDAERIEVKGEIASLERVLKALDADEKVKAKVKADGDKADPTEVAVTLALRRAGPGNVAKVEEALRDLGGTVSQHRITEHTGLNNGTVSYALKALRNQQKVRRTGKRIGHSPEYQISGSTRALPGSA